MLSIGGIVFLLACVFGTFIVTGGAIGPLMGSMPFELLTIGGAAIGVLVAGNSMHDLKHTLGDFKKIIKGSQFHQTDYVDLLCLLFFLVKLAATKGSMALERISKRPARARYSSIFRKSSPINTPPIWFATICGWWE